MRSLLQYAGRCNGKLHSSSPQKVLDRINSLPGIVHFMMIADYTHPSEKYDAFSLLFFLLHMIHSSAVMSAEYRRKYFFDPSPR